MSTWGQSDKYIAAWIHHISNKRFRHHGILPSSRHTTHPPLELPLTQLFEKLLKNCTQVDSLPSELLHNIYIWRAGLVHHNKLKLAFVLLTQHHPVICVSTSYKLKCPPFCHFMHYNHILYVWEYRRLGPRKYDHKWGKELNIKHEPV